MTFLRHDFPGGAVVGSSDDPCKALIVFITCCGPAGPQQVMVNVWRVPDDPSMLEFHIFCGTGWGGSANEVTRDAEARGYLYAAPERMQAYWCAHKSRLYLGEGGTIRQSRPGSLSLIAPLMVRN